MDRTEARRRFSEARFARLGTVRPDGSPHLVPVVFAVEGDRVVTAVDDKPKRTRRLVRLANVEAEPRVCLLVDHEDEHWDRLWWVRAEGRARVVPEGPDLARAIELLAEKYPAYRVRRPSGPAIVIDVERWRGWSAG